MDSWLSALIAAAAALLSAGLTTAFAIWTANRQRDDRQQDEVQAVLTAYLYALERLAVEIGQLPPAPARTVARLNTAVERAPTMNWALQQVSRHTLARPAIRAVDALMASATRLTLVAPPDILEKSEPIAVLLGRFAERDAVWDEQFAQARKELIAAARAAMTPPRRRLMGRSRQ